MHRVWILPALLSIATVVASGCGKGPQVDKPTGGSTAGGGSSVASDGSGTMNKTLGSDSGKATFVRGAPLTPKDQLIAWLDNQKLDGKPRLLRLPIVLPKGPMGYDISKARLGGAADALEVYANDASLGIGLADRARQACKGTDAPTCAFWVEGYWLGQQMGGLELDVKKAEVLAADQVAGATHAEVEGESGN